MTTKNNLFSQIKQKNTNIEDFQNNLHQFLKDFPHVEIENIRQHKNNLLYVATIYENEEIFEYLTNQYSLNFKKENNYYNYLQLIYSNKSPKILKMCVENTNFNNENKKELMELVSLNCYRTENIMIMASLFEKIFSNEEKTEFVTLLTKNNNIRFIYESSKNNNWKIIYKENKKIIEDFSNKIKNPNLYYLITHTEPKEKENLTVQTEELNLEKQPTIIVKKRRLAA